LKDESVRVQLEKENQQKIYIKSFIVEMSSHSCRGWLVKSKVHSAGHEKGRLELTGTG
jgi:hypothetical protein